MPGTAARSPGPPAAPARSSGAGLGAGAAPGASDGHEDHGRPGSAGSPGPESGLPGIRITWRETPRAARALLLGVFVNRLAGFIQIFLVLFLSHQGFSAGQAGLALGCYGGGAVVGTFVGGSLTDRLSPRSTALVSMVGSAVLIIVILNLRIYPLLVAAVFLVSTVGQLYRPMAQTLLAALTPGDRLVMVTAMYRLGLNLGTSAASLIGTALLTVSYSLLFWGEALAALAYAVIALIALPGHVTRLGETSEPAGAAPPRRASSGAGSYRAMLADRRYVVFLAAVFLISVVYCQYTAALPLAITRAGLNIWWYSAVVTLNALIVVTCELLMTKFVQRWPLRLTVFAGIGLVAIGYGVYAIAMVPALLIAGTLIWTLSEIIGAPTVFAYPAMAGPEHLRGRYIGAMQGLFGLGAAVGPIVGIMLWDHVGQSVWLWVAGVAALAIVAGQIGIRTTAHCHLGRVLTRSGDSR